MRDIKAFIVCAGRATRMRPFTNNIPKAMMRIKEKPVIFYIIAHLMKYDITEIAINVHYKPFRLLEFLNGAVKVFYEHKLRGTAGALLPAYEWLSDDFIYMNGDTLSNLNVSEIVKFHQDNNFLITIFTSDNAIHSGGTYVLNKKILDFIPKDIYYSLHEDLIPELLQQYPDRIGLYREDIPYYDIGTLKGFMRAQREWKND